MRFAWFFLSCLSLLSVSVVACCHSVAPQEGPDSGAPRSPLPVDSGDASAFDAPAGDASADSPDASLATPESVWLGAFNLVGVTADDYAIAQTAGDVVAIPMGGGALQT